MRFTVATLALLTALAIPAAAHADDMFTITFSGPGFSGSGVLTGTPDTLTSGLTDVYDITSASGTVNGQSFTLYPIPNQLSVANSTEYTILDSGNFYIDDVLYLGGNPINNLGGATDGLVDYEGLLFKGADGTGYEIWTDENNPGNFIEDLPGDYDSGGVTLDTLTITPGIAPTPEPSSLALLSTGLLGAVGLFRRRSNA